MEAINQKKLFNPQVAFFSLPIVYWTMILGSLIIFVISALIIHHENCYLDLSSTGFNDLLTMFKMPIATLGFFAALLALYATNHRSEQNRASMELTDSQNRFSNYYKHIEEYKNYIEAHFGDALSTSKDTIADNLPATQKVTIRARRLHKALYPNAKIEGIKFSDKIELKIFDVLFKFITCIASTEFSKTEDIEYLILVSDDCMTSISRLLLDSITFSKFSQVEINFYKGDRTIKIPNGLLKSYINSCVEKFKVISEILYFEENFNFELFESLLTHTQNASHNIPDFFISGKEIKYSTTENTNILEIAPQEHNNLIEILKSVKKSFPKYNSYL